MAGPQLAFPSPSLSQPNQIGFRNMLVVTSTQNWVVPAGVTAVKATVVGGGAGSAATNGNGAGAGGTAIKMITGLVSGQVIPLTVAATASQNAVGNTSSFGSYCSATGGAIDRVGGIGVGGDINIRGGSGGAGVGAVAGPACSSIGVYLTGIGGQSTHGAGAYSQNSSGTAVGGYPYGGGGSGSFAGGANGGIGGQGVIIIEY